MKVKNLISSAAFGLCMLGGSSAYAAGVFTVNPTNLDSGYTNSLGFFQSDYIAGNYQEIVTLKADGTFGYSLFWRGTQFDLGGSAVQDGLNNPGPSTGLGNSYSLYATLQGSGTYSLSGTSVTFNPATGAALDLYAAKGVGVASSPTIGGDPYGLNTLGTVYHLLTGTTISASGNVKQGSGNDFGSFGVVTTAALVAPDGGKFFTAPVPFFDLSFEAGNFNNYWLDTNGGDVVLGTYSLGGGAQITFGKVPEPTSIALVGLALTGLGVSMRLRRT